MGFHTSKSPAKQVLLVGVLLLCSWFGAARAEAPLEVLLLPNGSPTLARKIAAEGRYAGLSLVELTTLDQKTSAEALARSGASAAVEVVSDQEVLLTVTSQQAAESRVFRLRRTNEAESFPLHVIEHLRAELTDFGWALPEESRASPVPSPAHSEVVPPARAQAPLPAGDRTDGGGARSSARGARWQFWLNGGLSALRAGGGLGTMIHGLLGIRLEPGGGWGAGALVLLPLASNELQQPEGEAEVSVTAYLLQASYAHQLGAGWQGALAMGPGLAVLPLAATATPPLTGNTDRLLCGIGTLELSLSRPLASWIRLQGSLLVGITAPRPVLSFAGREAAAWGRALGVLALRVELGLPPLQEARE